MSLQQLINFLVKNNTGPQNKLIKGTWKLTGQVLEENGYKNNEFVFKQIDHTLIIDQATGVNEDFIMVHSSSNSAGNNAIAYCPGIIVQASPLIVHISVNQDNGVFRFVEQKRDSNGEVSVLSGTLIESGYSKESILQEPTVGKVIMTKINKANTLPLISPQSIPFPLSIPNLRPSQLFYSTNQFDENLQREDPNYTIEGSGPLLNVNQKIVGFVSFINSYTKKVGTTVCESVLNYNIYTTIHDVDATSYDSVNVYTPLPQDHVRATFSVTLHFQGLLNQSTYMAGTLTSLITNTTGDIPQTFSPVIAKITGRVDGLCVIECDHITYLMSTPSND